ncbi:MAG: MiaB/RimO family radical SAM methylthiotransferase [Candidatus Gracilibacteria bacterium]|nr:MiaB/RimO family radical SAM methylthiotransferase [Candidatus Gracilibacteria bacterium]
MSFRFSSINLGCSKNLVDLEFAIGEILKYSDRTPIEYIEDPEDPETDYVIVNTCGFLSSAREESEDTLQHYDRLGKKLILMGCYVSVKDDNFLSSLKNLHSVVPFISYSTIEGLLFGKTVGIDMSAIVRAKVAMKQSKEKKLTEYLDSIGEKSIKKRGSQEMGKNDNIRAKIADRSETYEDSTANEETQDLNTKIEVISHLPKSAFIWRGDEVRAYIHAPFGYEYLKIAEGCDNSCTFCIIPQIRGKQTSRKMEDIVKEVNTMLASGIREVQIIAQDTTRYGTDLYGEPRLFELLEQIEAIPGDFTYRLYYMYPDILTLEHVQKLKTFKKLLPYFDIPFQHSSERILKRMGRHYDEAHVEAFLASIRENFPNAFIRTSFIVGFPGETDADFNHLLEFVKRHDFESVGVFQYHDEPLAASSRLDHKVSEAVVNQRMKKLAKVLDEIYAKHARNARGKTFSGYIMDADEKRAIIRREIQAPEVDEYDEVKLSAIKGSKPELEIGKFIEYKL